MSDSASRSVNCARATCSESSAANERVVRIIGPGPKQSELTTSRTFAPRRSSTTPAERRRNASLASQAARGQRIGRDLLHRTLLPRDGCSQFLATSSRLERTAGKRAFRARNVHKRRNIAIAVRAAFNGVEFYRFFGHKIDVLNVTRSTATSSPFAGTSTRQRPLAAQTV